MTQEELNRRRGSAKGNVTRATTQLKLFARIEPHKRLLNEITRQAELISNAESMYLETVDLEALDLSFKDEYGDEDSTKFAEFNTAVSEARALLVTLQQEQEASVAFRAISQELREWEELDEINLQVAVKDDYSRICQQLQDLRKHPGIDLLPDLRDQLRSLRQLLGTFRSKTESKPEEGSTSGDKDNSYTEVKKARTMPLPIFRGNRADWRAFWRRFKDALARIKNISNDERLTLLLESLKDQEAQSIVSVAIRNGEAFELVEKRLAETCDQPQEVFLDATKDLLNIPKISRSASSLATAAETLTQCLSTFQQYGDGTLEQLIAALLEIKMESRILEDWRLTLKTNAIPTASELLKFMQRRKTALGSLDREVTRDKTSTASVKSNHGSKYGGKVHSNLHVSDCLSCSICHLPHQVFSCPKFRDMDNSQRMQIQQEARLCYNCLRPGHNSRACKSVYSCRECGKRHHTLLHRTGSAPRQQSMPSITPQPQSSSQQALAAPPTSTSSATSVSSLTATLPDKTSLLCSFRAILEVQGRKQAVRGIIDTASTMSFMTYRVADGLKAKHASAEVNVTGLAQSHSTTCRHKAEVMLRSFELPEEGSVCFAPALLSSITADTPTNDLSCHASSKFISSLKLADPDFGKPGRVDLLLGLDIIPQIVRPGWVISDDRTLFSFNSIFGCVLGGACTHPGQAAKVHVCCQASADFQLDSTLRAFWEIEEVPLDISKLSPDDQSAMEQFEADISRTAEGRYVVTLPRKDPTPHLGPSKSQAIRRYRQNRASLQNKGRWEEFHEAVQEYAKMGHSEIVPIEDSTKPSSDTYYFPMHGIVKESSTTTKLRVVFDASASSASGFSLNDTLLTGPSLYPQLANILMRFRIHQIGLSSDISKMFREVVLHNYEKDFHRYVLQTDTGEWQDWRMTRLTFGVKSSPFLATQVLRRLADDYQQTYPLAAELVRSSFYVDDCITGADTLEQAKHIRETLNELLSKACMTLRKWRSSSQELLQSIPDELKEMENELLIGGPSSQHKTLGLHWDPVRDTLHVATPDLSTTGEPTKRRLLADIAQTFDVLGWYAPVTVIMKIQIQRLWLLGIEWDDPVPDDVARHWTSWKEQLHLLTEHPIDRKYHNKDKEILSVQLHGFSDSSEVAYGGVVYIRTTYTNNTTSTSLVIAKSRVAPVKRQTIPKLELTAALLTAKLLHTVKDQLNVQLSHVFLWTDSTIVLHWLKTPSYLLKTYVANRTTTSNSLIPSSHWRHVSTKENPADLCSRGIPAVDLLETQLWWEGPSWFRQSPDYWPAQSTQPPDHIPEVNVLTAISPVVKTEQFLVSRYSSLCVLINVLSWILRFVSNCRRPKENRTLTHFLYTKEIQDAEEKLVRNHRRIYFDSEITSLENGSFISQRSPLVRLSPILDAKGLLRVGGRLGHSKLPYSQAHPLILAKKTRLAKMIVTRLHLSSLHAGPTQLMALLSSSYYILGARNLVREVSRNCVRCQRTYARVAAQQMGELPASRVQPAPPFARTGVDFAGPVILRRGYTRKPVQVKAYISLFICLITKAVHLELVCSLSSCDFIAALKRFVARRGCPEEIVTDNGTNFMGTNSELKRMYRLLHDSKAESDLHQFFNSKRIIWSFIPGRAPHFGGLWEAGVKSAKTILRKLLGTQVLTLEEFSLILCETEAVLNSRPLCPMDSLPEDGLEALTPGHFLIGRPLVALPLNQDHLKCSSIRRWNLCQKITSEFWQRWSGEYLQSLQRRSKWFRPQKNLAVGDLVLIKDTDTMSRQWPLARVIRTCPGQDGLVRAVIVKTAQGTYSRPIVKLVPLLADENSSIKTHLSILS